MAADDLSAGKAPRRAARGAVPGLYVAANPWLDVPYGADGLYKVGETGDLRCRLRDSAYVTCFPPGSWRYAFTFETASKGDAQRAEAAVLHAAASRRIGGASELVRCTRKELRDLAAGAVAALGIEGKWREDPAYSAPPVRAPTAAAAARAAEAAAPLLGPDELAALRPLALASATALSPVLGGGDAPRATDAPGDPVAGIAASLAELSLAEPAARARKAVDDDDDENEPAALDPMLELEALGGPALAPPVVLETRDYQTEAAAACLRELAAAGKTIIKMACRCGKTRVAHLVIRQVLGEAPGRRVLFLVPGLALLGQTVAKLDAYGLAARALLVGSDGRPYRPRGGLRALAEDGELAPTTDPAVIARACADSPAPLIVVSTYQSSPLLPDVFDLVVFDEAHRACGDARPRPFTKVLLDFTRGRRLFMTATPRYDGKIQMKDRARFGGEAFSYPLRRGIDEGYVNPFELRLLGGPGGGPMADLICEAMSGVDKLLVFCRSIRHAVELAGEVRARDPGFSCLTAHSKMPGHEVGKVLQGFGGPGRAALFNCRLLQEGVELPALNGVFFAAPRHAPRDIIQSLCRPLNRMPEKPPSRIFVPVTMSPGLPPEAPENLGRFCTLLPFFDALIGEDPLLYEHKSQKVAPQAMSCQIMRYPPGETSHNLAGAALWDGLAENKTAGPNDRQEDCGAGREA